MPYLIAELNYFPSSKLINENSKMYYIFWQVKKTFIRICFIEKNFDYLNLILSQFKIK